MNYIVFLNKPTQNQGNGEYTPLAHHIHWNEQMHIEPQKEKSGREKLKVSSSVVDTVHERLWWCTAERNNLLHLLIDVQ